MDTNGKDKFSIQLSENNYYMIMNSQGCLDFGFANSLDDS
jgi:hypothetical protein